MRYIRYVLCVVMVLFASCVQGNMPFTLPHSNIPQSSEEATQKETHAMLSLPKQEGPPASFPSSLTAGQPVNIALLLPLSGKYQKLGEGMLDAAQLVLFQMNAPNLTILPYDTGDTSFGATEAAKKAIADQVEVILGPVFSSSAKAVGKVAAAHGIPVVSFSNDASLMGSGVFALGFRPEQQVQQVIRRAMKDGIEEFTAILPNNAYGAAVAKTLRETVEAYPGVSVLKTEFYRFDAEGRPMDLLNHVNAVSYAALTKKPEKDYDKKIKRYNTNPIKYPRALLVPVGGNELKEILALLHQQQVAPDKLILLGSSQWKDIDVYDAVLQNAIFTASPREQHNLFENRFRETYGYEPPSIASLAYDAIALAVTVSHMSDGQKIAAGVLTDPRGFLGIDGIFRLKKDGLVERGFDIIRIENGEARVYEPAPTSFSEEGQGLVGQE